MAEHRNEANEYIKTHRLDELMGNLTSQLAFNQPDDPREFLVETLAGLIKAKEAGTVAPGLFEGKDFGAIFGTFDVSRSGYISLKDYNTAMGLLGYAEYNATPAGASLGKIALQTFTAEATAASTVANATYAK
eukprot:gene1577-2695_t